MRRRGTLPDTIECPECIEATQGWPSQASRAEVNHVHGQHQPMHPDQTGANHKAAARKAYAAWEALSPYRVQQCPQSPTGAPCVHRTRPSHGGLCEDGAGNRWPDTAAAPSPAPEPPTGGAS